MEAVGRCGPLSDYRPRTPGLGYISRYHHELTPELASLSILEAEEGHPLPLYSWQQML